MGWSIYRSVHEELIIYNEWNKSVYVFVMSMVFWTERMIQRMNIVNCFVKYEFEKKRSN